MYVCMYVLHACMYVCMDACMHACVSVCLSVCMYVYVCMYVSVYFVFVYVHICVVIYIWHDIVGHNNCRLHQGSSDDKPHTTTQPSPMDAQWAGEWCEHLICRCCCLRGLMRRHWSYPRAAIVWSQAILAMQGLRSVLWAAGSSWDFNVICLCHFCWAFSPILVRWPCIVWNLWDIPMVSRSSHGTNKSFLIAFCAWALPVSLSLPLSPSLSLSLTLSFSPGFCEVYEQKVCIIFATFLEHTHALVAFLCITRSLRWPLPWQDTTCAYFVLACHSISYIWGLCL